MASKISVHWLPLVAIDPKWQLEFFKVWDRVDPQRNFSEPATAGQFIDLCILAYPATDHKLVVDSKSLAQKVTEVAQNSDVRLLVISCERTWPKVTKGMLAQLLIDQIPHELQNQHHDLLHQTSDFEPIFIKVFELTLRAKGLWQDYSAVQTNKALNDPAAGERSDLWNQ